VLLATGLVLTVKVAVLVPAATVTLEGTVAAAVLLLASATTAPPAGAAALSLSTPMEELPPVTEEGNTKTEEMVADGGVTVSAAICVVPL